MVTKTYFFSGPVKYAYRLFEPDMKYKTEARGGVYSLVMNLSGESLSLYNALGPKSKPVTEQDVAIYKIKKPDGTPPTPGDVHFRRYERHTSLGELGAPKVHGVSEGKHIGDGTIGTVEAEVYSYNFEGETGFAVRLVSFTVDKLIEYIKPVASGDEPPVF